MVKKDQGVAVDQLVLDKRRLEIGTEKKEETEIVKENETQG